MSIAPEDKRTSPYDRFRQQAEELFNAQLERLGLSASQIAEQQIPELEDTRIVWCAKAKHVSKRSSFYSEV